MRNSNDTTLLICKRKTPWGVMQGGARQALSPEPQGVDVREEGVARALHTVWPQTKPPGCTHSRSQSQCPASQAQHGHHRPPSGPHHTMCLLVGLGEKKKCLFFFFLLFRAALEAHGASQARGQIRAVTASLRHIHSNGAATATYTTAQGNAGSLTH